MEENKVRTSLIDILKQDHQLEISETDLQEFGPRDVGLDSLSEAELFLQLSEALDLKEVTSPESGSNFGQIIDHFQKSVNAHYAK